LGITVPSGVKVHVDGDRVRVEGPKGKLEGKIEPGVTINVDAGKVTVTRADDERRTRGMHGLTRKLVSNMVDGVAKGFTRVLEINGVGYRAEVKGRMIVFQLGYSHPVAVHLPEGMTAKIERQVIITLEAADRQQLGQMAAVLRGLRPPEPYKGKGIKYAEETIRRKAGKAAAGASR